MNKVGICCGDFVRYVQVYFEVCDHSTHDSNP